MNSDLQYAEHLDQGPNARTEENSGQRPSDTLTALMLGSVLIRVGALLLTGNAWFVVAIAAHEAHTRLYRATGWARLPLFLTSMVEFGVYQNSMEHGVVRTLLLGVVGLQLVHLVMWLMADVPAILTKHRDH